MPELQTYSEDEIRSFDPRELQFRLTTLQQRKAVYKHDPNLRLLDDYMEKVRRDVSIHPNCVQFRRDGSTRSGMRWNGS